MKWSIRLPEGDEIPRGYGVAWRDWSSYRAICMPIPLNLVAGLARRMWFTTMRGVWPSQYERDVAQAYHRGRTDEAINKVEQLPRLVEQELDRRFRNALWVMQVERERASEQQVS